MVFGFLFRKESRQQSQQEEINEAGPSSAPISFQFPSKQQLHTPAPSIDVIRPSPSFSDTPGPAGPLDSPSPPPDDERLVTDASTLHTLIASVPAQTLHAYTLLHLSPPPPSPYPVVLSTPALLGQPKPTAPPSPRTLTALTRFFSSLTPPPKLHCLRCHGGYFELENTDTSCHVAHDDDSATVERIKTGLGGEYETLWGCCEKTVEGDGDMGPPDGWCYEGKHTTDPKRARFRADSTPSDDKLTSCTSLRCHEPHLRPRTTRSRASTARKRNRQAMEVDGEGDEQDSVASSQTGSHSQSISSKKGKVEQEEGEGEMHRRPTKRARSRKPSSSMHPLQDSEMAMDVDVPSIPASPPRSPRRKVAAKAANKITAVAPSPPKPISKSSTSRPVQKSPLSSSFTPGCTTPSRIETPPPALPLSRSVSPSRRGPNSRIVEVAISSSPTLKATASVGSLKSKGSLTSLKETSNSKNELAKRPSLESLSGNVAKPPRTRSAKARMGSNLAKTKPLSQIVDTSVDAKK